MLIHGIYYSNSCNDTFPQPLFFVSLLLCIRPIGHVFVSLYEPFSVVFFQDRLLFGSATFFAKFSLNWCCRYSCELIYTVSFNLASPTCKFLWMEDCSLFFACFFQLFIITFSNYPKQLVLLTIDDSIIIIQNSGFSKPKYSLVIFYVVLLFIRCTVFLFNPLFIILLPPRKLQKNFQYLETLVYTSNIHCRNRSQKKTGNKRSSAVLPITQPLFERGLLLSDSPSFRQIVGMSPSFQSANLTFHVD